MLPTERGRGLDALMSREVFHLPVKLKHGRMGMAQWCYQTMRWQSLPHYSSSRDDAADVEYEIERRGLVHRYLHLLTNLIIDNHSAIDQGVETREWALIRIHPEYRCLAALAAVREARKATK